MHFVLCLHKLVFTWCTVYLSLAWLCFKKLFILIKKPNHFSDIFLLWGKLLFILKWIKHCDLPNWHLGWGLSGWSNFANRNINKELGNGKNPQTATWAEWSFPLELAHGDNFSSWVSLTPKLMKVSCNCSHAKFSFSDICSWQGYQS